MVEQPVRLAEDVDGLSDDSSPDGSYQHRILDRPHQMGRSQDLVRHRFGPIRTPVSRDREENFERCRGYSRHDCDSWAR